MWRFRCPIASETKRLRWRERKEAKLMRRTSWHSRQSDQDVVQEVRVWGRWPFACGRLSGLENSTRTQDQMMKEKAKMRRKMRSDRERNRVFRSGKKKKGMI